MAQEVKILLVALTSHMTVLVCDPAAGLPICFPANTPKKTVEMAQIFGSLWSSWETQKLQPCRK